MEEKEVCLETNHYFINQHCNLAADLFIAVPIQTTLRQPTHNTNVST